MIAPSRNQYRRSSVALRRSPERCRFASPPSVAGSVIGVIQASSNRKAISSGKRAIDLGASKLYAYCGALPCRSGEFPTSLHVYPGKNEKTVADRWALGSATVKPGSGQDEAPGLKLESSGLIIESLKDHIMNKLTATILASCVTFATAGAFAADSTSSDQCQKTQ